MVVCLAALLVLFLALIEQGMELWSLLPLILGGLSVALYWTTGPPLVVISLGFLTLAHRQVDWRRLGSIFTLRDPSRRFAWYDDEGLVLMDLVACAALLVYVVAQYRLLALVRHVLPVDFRRAGGPEPSQPMRRRSVSQVERREIAVMAAALPVWVGLAYAAWSLLQAQDRGWLGLRGDVWRIVLLVWVTGVGMIGTAVVVGYLGWRRASEEEARLYLQDQLWRQTRREQARLNHWVHAARLRRRRRDETP
jgi:hypothetical protein